MAVWSAAGICRGPGLGIWCLDPGITGEEPFVGEVPLVIIIAINISISTVILIIIAVILI